MTKKDVPKKAAKPDQRPEWLKDLAVESWQPEMIISGAIILGSTYIPGFVEEAYTLLSMRGGEEVQVLISLIRVYLLIGAMSITLNFVFHFVLRTLWVGLVGLLSVYPEGIRREKLWFGEDFKNKFMEQFSDLEGFTLSLDRICSVIFGFAANVFLVFLSISWAILWTYFVFYLLLQFLPEPWRIGNTQNLYFGFLGIVLLPSFLVSVLSLKPLRDKSWVKRIHYPLFAAYGKAFFSIFWKPIHFIQYVFITNLSGRKYSAFLIVYMLIVAFGTGLFIGSKTVKNVSGIKLPTGNANPNFVKVEHYEELKNKDSYTLLPLIEKVRIETGEVLRGFIPIYKREEQIMDRLYGNYLQLEKAEREKQTRNQFRLERTQKYLTLSIDDSLSTPEFLTHHYPANREKGVLFYINTDSLNEGKHILTIKRAATLTERDSAQKPTVIPFWIDN